MRMGPTAVGPLGPWLAHPGSRL